MNNNRPNNSDTPDKWHWAITPEQIVKIKQRDRDTVNQVYFDNLSKFKRIAYRFCRNSKRLSFYRDCVQQIYADMIYYDYTNVRKLYRSLYRSFYRAACFDSSRIVSLDKAMFDDSENSFIATISAPEYDPDKYTEYEKSVKRVLQGIARQTQLNERGRDILTAVALNRLFYEGIFKDEYANAFTR